MTDWGFADIYQADEPRPRQVLEDVKGDGWRNILVVGRATRDGVHPETLALVGRARFLADELGCRVETVLIGTSIDAATEALSRYAVDTVYRVAAPDYASIEHTAKLVEAVVRRRRPELVLVFQSRTGDAITAYAAERLGVGFVIGASGIEVDTAERRLRVTHPGPDGFRIITQMQDHPQFVSMQRGLFRAPLEEPYANVQVHDLDIDVTGHPVEVLERRPPPARSLVDADRVVVVGARIRSKEEIDLARKLADALDAEFGVTVGIVERGLLDTEDVVGERHLHIRPRLLVTVGVRGSLDFLQAIDGDPTIAAIGSHRDDPIARKAAYLVPGGISDAVEEMLAAFGGNGS